MLFFKLCLLLACLGVFLSGVAALYRALFR